MWAMQQLDSSSSSFSSFNKPNGVYLNRKRCTQIYSCTQFKCKKNQVNRQWRVVMIRLRFNYKKNVIIIIMLWRQIRYTNATEGVWKIVRLSVMWLLLLMWYAIIIYTRLNRLLSISYNRYLCPFYCFSSSLRIIFMYYIFSDCDFVRSYLR